MPPTKKRVLKSKRQGSHERSAACVLFHRSATRALGNYPPSIGGALQVDNPAVDDDFAALVDAAKAAIYQGSVSVVRTYQPPAPEIRIGMVDLDSFPLELRMLLALFCRSPISGRSGAE
jgi:hypothetical protein